MDWAYYSNRFAVLVRCVVFPFVLFAFFSSTPSRVLRSDTGLAITPKP
jgi:hypothetical protein